MWGLSTFKDLGHWGGLTTEIDFPGESQGFCTLVPEAFCCLFGHTDDNIPPCEEGEEDSNRRPPPHLDGENGGETEEERLGLNRPIQSFDYHHGRQSMMGEPLGDDFMEEGPPEREIFDYNHRPPSWNMPPGPPHLPPMGPGGPEFHHGWGPPPGPPPPDFPPPIPYFDLPAGLMVAVVPVSQRYIHM